MSEVKQMTGKPSIDKPWMKYYPPIMMQMISMPKCTLKYYLKQHCPSMTTPAIHYYGEDIIWEDIFAEAKLAAKALTAMGVKEGDQIPVYLRLVPEFVPLLIAAEQIGASIVCRDNTLEENVEAAQKAGAKLIFAHSFLTEEEAAAYYAAGVEKIVLIDPVNRGSRDAMPEHVQKVLDSYYTGTPASGDKTMDWNEFLEIGAAYTGLYKVTRDITRPLFRAYTSGSTGPSKQVIHSAETMLDIVCQMNFYGASEKFRPNWLVICLPPALVAVVVSMVILPLASDKLLIMDPFCNPEDSDLEIMRYKANNCPMIPCLINGLVYSKRVPDDYDLSHLLAVGAGSESYNNKQMDYAEQWLHHHKCMVRVTTGYGSSEAGSNLSLPMAPKPIRNGNAGVPMPLSTVSIFKQGTTEELTYNEIGEICKTGPGNMLGYDNPEATAKALMLHPDGNVWLHTGDSGYMDEDGVFYTVNRGDAPRFGGGNLPIQTMENMVADADIEGMNDEFFVNVPDPEHEGCFLPYLFVVLEEGYTVDDIRAEVAAALEPHMVPVEIRQIETRPFWHFKTNRIGLSKQIQAELAAK